MTENDLIKKTLNSAKTIAMVGVSSIKKEISSNIKRRPSTIVMKYMQEFGYRVIPVNPFSTGEKIYGETVVSKLEDINIPIDIVDVFRPSKETLEIAKEAVKIKKIVETENITYIANKCIKQEYQKFFLKVNPVFPVLQKK